MGQGERSGAEASRRFGRYHLLYRFASGGMADVYVARLTGEEGFERLVAVKVIHEHLTREPQFVKMFIDEARLASRISHPNVALTLDLGKVDSKHFIAMEYVEGENLGGVLRRARPPVGYSARIVADAAAGLHAAHELRDAAGQLLGVVHRDISPQNILVSYDGAVKVVDFGVARARGSLHTTAQEFKGKFGYMSPEQFEAPERVDRRTDIFALGIVLHEAITRRRLFKAASEAASVARVLKGEIPPPSKFQRGCPPELERITMRALQRDPAKRYQTAQQMHDELERYIISCGEPVTGMTIAQMMRDLFADHIAHKRTLREHPPDVEDEETVPAVDVVSNTTLRSQVDSYHPEPRRRGRAVVPLVVIALLAGLVGLGLVLYRALRAPAPAAAAHAAAGTATAPDTRQKAADGPVPTVTIAARAEPASATIQLDGTPMSNPFEIQRPATGGTAELVVAAPGHRTQRFDVPLARGGTWTVSLTPEPGPAPGAKRKRRRRRGKRTGSGYLDNPYQ